MRFLESYSNYLNDVAVFQLRLQCFKHVIKHIPYVSCVTDSVKNYKT